MLLNPYRFATGGGGGGSYDYPHISNTATNSATSATSLALTFTAAAGDLIIIQFMGKSSGIPTPTLSTSGWTLLVSTPAGAQAKDFLWYKVAASAETGVTLSWSGGYNVAGLAIIIDAGSFQGAPVYATGGVDSNINPPSLTPAWGSAKNLWLATLAPNYPYSAALSSWPLPDNRIEVKTGTTTGDASVLVCTQVLTASSLDPAAWPAGTSSYGIPRTIAVRPA